MSCQGYILSSPDTRLSGLFIIIYHDKLYSGNIELPCYFFENPVSLESSVHLSASHM